MSTARAFDMLCFGDPVADTVIAVDQAPAPGGKVLGRALGLWAGGTTANVACAASRLGMRTAAYGRVGEDANAALLRASFEAFGVAQDFLENAAGCPSASTVALIDAAGEKTLVYLPMPPMAVRQEHLRAALLQARLLYAMPYDLEELTVLAGLARACGTLVAIDLEAAVAPDRAAMQARAALADIVFFNEAGFLAGTGQAPTPQALAEVLALGPSLAVVSLGAAGAIAVSAGQCVRQAAFRTQVQDTTGAGDCFNGAFLAAHLLGDGLERALAFACAAASFAVEAVGARSALPGRAMVLARMGDTAC